MTARAGRVLGLDLGSARIGLALSDPLRLLAQPFSVYERRGPRQDLEALAAVVAEHGVTDVVVGLPRRLSGSEGAAAAAARSFAEQLGARLAGIEVRLWDERLSTVEAERTLVEAGVRRARRRDVVDKIAAALILQSFLDATSGPEGS